VHLFRIDVPALPYPKGFLLSTCVVGIFHSQGPVEDEVRCFATVLVWGIVCIASNSQSKTMIDE
jgi:hypothetical protein